MKTKLGVIAVLVLCGPLWALKIEMHNVSNNLLFSGIEFKQIYLNNSAVAKQYLKIEYPEVINQYLRLYTNNSGWQGPAGQGSGLISISSNADSLPLYWISFSTPQPPGGVFFSTTVSASSWTKTLDLQDPNFLAARNSANIPL